MRPPIIGTALPIAVAVLITWSLTIGSLDDTGGDWLLRTLIVYPLWHAGVRSYQQQHWQRRDQ